MKKIFLITLICFIWVFSLFGVYVLAQAPTPVVSHPASQINPGSFQNGNYTFSGSLFVGGAVNSQLFYDTNNPRYHVDPTGLSRLTTVHAEGEIKSTTKSEWKDVPLSTIMAYQSLCNHENLSQQTALLYCISGCNRYCREGLGYSGGTLSEYDGNRQRVGCVCIP